MRCRGYKKDNTRCTKMTQKAYCGTHAKFAQIFERVYWDKKRSEVQQR